MSKGQRTPRDIVSRVQGDGFLKVGDRACGVTQEQESCATRSRIQRHARVQPRGELQCALRLADGAARRGSPEPLICDGARGGRHVRNHDDRRGGSHQARNGL